MRPCAAIGLTLLALLALALAGCAPMPPGTGTPGFVQSHTQCPSATYDSLQWSPDGALIYYTAHLQIQTDGQAHVVDSGGGRDRLLAEHVEGPPLLSPDGSMLLIAGPRTAYGTASYEVMDTRSWVKRPLGELGLGGYWSPDSRWIYTHNDRTLWGQLFRADAHSGQSAALTTPSTVLPANVWAGPAWSGGPDPRIAFSTGRVYIAAETGADVLAVPLAHDPECKPPAAESENEGGWSADPGGGGAGSSLAVIHYCSDWGGTLRFVGPDGKEQHRWGRAYGRIDFLGWSPSVSEPGGLSAAGSQVLFRQTILGAGGSIKVGVAASDASNMTFFPEGMADASWSPDGGHILLQGSRDSLYVADANPGGDWFGVQPRQLVPSGASATWSTDPASAGSGIRIAYVAPDAAGLEEIYTIRLDGGGLTQITHNPGAGGVCLH